MIRKSGILAAVIFLLGGAGFAQDIEGVYVEQGVRTEAKMKEDKQQCYLYSGENVDQKKHRTLKNSGIGAGAGAVVGAIFGKPGAGAAAGGAAGAYRGHRKNNKDERAFQETYASCLREKGYDVEIEED